MAKLKISSALVPVMKENHKRDKKDYQNPRYRNWKSYANKKV